MKFLRYFLLFGALIVPAALMSTPANAQVGVGIGIGDGGYGDYGYGYPAPVCSWGYYNYYPYACAPYGYYGCRAGCCRQAVWRGRHWRGGQDCPCCSSQATCQPIRRYAKKCCSAVSSAKAPNGPFRLSRTPVRALRLMVK